MIKQIKENKYLKSLLILIMLVLIIIVARISYAYFKLMYKETGPTGIEVNMHETAALQFIPGNPLEMDVNKSTLPKEGTNLSVVSNPKAKLLIKDNEESLYYNVYFTISSNDFTYTTPEEIPEIILTITGPDGNELTQEDIPDLPYIEADSEKYQNVTGFDVTQYSGTVMVKENQEISLAMVQDTDMEQNWTFSLTYINLDFNQSANLDKSLTVEVKMQQAKTSEEEEPPVELPEYEKTIRRLLADSNKEGETPTLIKHSAEAMADIEIANEDLIADDDSYRYSGSSEAVKNYVCLDGTSSANECNSDADLYRIIGLFPNESGEYEMKLIKYDYATEKELGNKSTASGGAYSGKYTDTNTYYKGNNIDNIAAYYWNYYGTDNYDNMWKDSNLNKINLNTFYLNNYLNNVDKLTSNIANHTWTVSGVPYNHLESAAYFVYEKELGTNKLTTTSNKCYTNANSTTSRLCNQTDDLTYKAKIGLMYVSDYGYAASSDTWNIQSSSYDKAQNWMYMGLYEWTITRNHDAGTNSWYIDASGYQNDYFTAASMYAVRPVFYLTSSTKLASGDGSKTNPYRLSWN